MSAHKISNHNSTRKKFGRRQTDGNAMALSLNHEAQESQGKVKGRYNHSKKNREEIKELEAKVKQSRENPGSTTKQPPKTQQKPLSFPKGLMKQVDPENTSCINHVGALNALPEGPKVVCYSADADVEPEEPLQTNRADFRNSFKVESTTLKNRRHSAFGKVPSYLQSFKREMQQKKEDDEALKTYRKEVPEGYRLMSTDECQATLATLIKERQELGQLFQRLPLKIETLGQEKRRDALETKIKEIDGHIELLSRPKILVEL